MTDRATMTAEAGQLLNHPAYKASYEAVERFIVGQLKSTPIETEADERKVVNLVMRLQNLDGARRWLDQIVQTGKIEEKRQAEKAEKQQGGRKKGLV